MNYNNSFRYYKLFLFVLFILSMYPWFSWNMPVQYISVIGALYTLYLLARNQFLKLKNISLGTALLFLLLFLWIDKYNNMFSHVEAFCNWIIFVGLLALKEDFKPLVISSITKWFSIILGVSLIFYIAHMVGVSLPSSPLERANALKSFANYYFFISIDGQVRFQSIFFEPGHLTMGLAPLLFLNIYNYKDKYVLILLLAQLFSFSLAGYVVMVVGYSYIIMFSHQNNKLLHILLPVSLFIGFLYAITLIFEEDLFYDLIMSRLEWTGSGIAGDDRSSIYLDKVYKQILDSPNRWLGQEWLSSNSEKGVAGYKLYFVMYGVIGVLITLSAYIKSLLLSRNNISLRFGFFIVVMLLLWQNSYPTWWSLLILMTCGFYLEKEYQTNK